MFADAVGFGFVAFDAVLHSSPVTVHDFCAGFTNAGTVKKRVVDCCC